MGYIIDRPVDVAGGLAAAQLQVRSPKTSCFASKNSNSKTGTWKVQKKLYKCWDKTESGCGEALQDTCAVPNDISVSFKANEPWSQRSSRTYAWLSYISQLQRLYRGIGVLRVAGEHERDHRSNRYKMKLLFMTYTQRQDYQFPRIGRGFQGRYHFLVLFYPDGRLIISISSPTPRPRMIRASPSISIVELGFFAVM